jgi:hypothetical protein
LTVATTRVEAPVPENDPDTGTRTVITWVVGGMVVMAGSVAYLMVTGKLPCGVVLCLGVFVLSVLVGLAVTKS